MNKFSPELKRYIAQKVPQPINIGLFISVCAVFYLAFSTLQYGLSVIISDNDFNHFAFSSLACLILTIIVVCRVRYIKVHQNDMVTKIENSAFDFSTVTDWQVASQSGNIIRAIVNFKMTKAFKDDEYTGLNTIFAKDEIQVSVHSKSQIDIANKVRQHIEDEFGYPLNSLMISENSSDVYFTLKLDKLHLSNPTDIVTYTAKNNY